jgi:hypothetical protein
LCFLQSMPFDSTSLFLLLSNMRFDVGVGSLDAVAISYGLDILQASSVRGTKRMFVLTDGYSTCGLQVRVLVCCCYVC